MVTEPPAGVLEKPKAILFDWDNTLVDSWPCIHDALNTTLVAMGQAAWSLEETRERVGLSMRDAFPQLFKDRWEEARDIFFARFKAIHLERLALTPNARALLETLAGQGVRLAVVSNKTGDFLRIEAAQLGLTSVFDALVGAGDAPRDKPAPDPGYMALAPSGLAPGPTVWFVGDSDVDLACAAALGCTGILVRPEPPRPGEFADTPPHAHVNGCGALRALLDRLGTGEPLPSSSSPDR
ncbi:HAD family hydrolase [Pararhodospirillum oryzae]|uniref:phosphoglycolate phosphatase n=1 Tax=Pararhodospirillum oryzae TaxID=478448 RepID=A0A512H384_9PROT|nr:HAD-IA family hydrolase [Pararhodospirillum oryzae]GEO79915.1 haloacid dehalogenase [Pararhodospirillum oryzae]